MGAPDKTTTSNNNNNNNNSMQRVKVYRLNDEGKWDDQGTGHVTIDYLEVRHNSRSEDLGLFVTEEDVNETLLVHRICSEDIYRKQEDTIISWKDPDYSSEFALSFQETSGCSYIWDHICNVQRNLHFNTLSNETYHGANSELRELPEVELSTLPSILKVVVNSSITDQLCVTELILHDQKFFRKLMDLFTVCEDLENYDGLHIVYKIVRGIILLNSPPIFEKIFSDELIMDIVGCLEYDPDVPHVHHRNFLKEHVVYKEAIPIKDSLALSKIHQTYRISYLKDVILARVLDDATVASLNTIIHSNNGMVITMLKDDSTFIKDLFTRLKSHSLGHDSKMNLVYFLQEFCNLSKSLQMVQQQRIFRDLVTEGIFDVIADILQSEDNKLILTGTDILMLFVSQDPTLLRSYVSRQEGVSLIGLLVKCMLKDFGNAMHGQFLDIIRSLLDTYSPAGQRDAIVDIFYEKHLDELLDVILSSCSSNSNLGNQKSAKPEILLNIYDLLCFCVLQHPSKIKSIFLRTGVIEKVLSLTRRREKYLVVAAIRFIRTLISFKDEQLMSHIAKNNLFKPIVDVFVGNGSRYNLLNSVVLELFEYIRKENLKILVKYLVETFWEKLVKFDSLPSLQLLKVKYEQAMEQASSQPGPNAMNTRRRVDERALDKEEEDYFNDDSDEEDSTSASLPRTTRVRPQPSVSNGSPANIPSLSPRAGGLVDYEDDEDDDDYKPPPRIKSEDDDEAGLELRLKRKLLSSKQSGSVKKQKLSGKSSKLKESVFATLCSTLSQTVIPSKKTTNAPNSQVGPTNEKTRQGTSSNENKEADKGGLTVGTTEMAINGS